MTKYLDKKSHVSVDIVHEGAIYQALKNGHIHENQTVRWQSHHAAFNTAAIRICTTSPMQPSASGQPVF